MEGLPSQEDGLAKVKELENKYRELTQQERDRGLMARADNGEQLTEEESVEMDSHASKILDLVIELATLQRQFDPTTTFWVTPKTD
jgi:hypothetical protein